MRVVAEVEGPIFSQHEICTKAVATRYATESGGKKRERSIPFSGSDSWELTGRVLATKDVVQFTIESTLAPVILHLPHLAGPMVSPPFFSSISL